MIDIYVFKKIKIKEMKLPKRIFIELFISFYSVLRFFCLFITRNCKQFKIKIQFGVHVQYFQQPCFFNSIDFLLLLCFQFEHSNKFLIKQI